MIERERNIDVKVNISWLPPARLVLGMDPETLQCMGVHPTNRASMARPSRVLSSNSVLNGHSGYHLKKHCWR